MNRHVIEIQAGKLGEALTERLPEKPDPSQKLRVTIEPLPDYSDIPPDVLESQKQGIGERMKPGGRAGDGEVDSLFRKWAE